MNRRPRVLVLRALGLGDLLAAVPALRGIKRAHPGHEIVLAAPADLREAVRATETVDTLLPTRAPDRAVPTLEHWTGPPPDIAIDLHGNGAESRAALERLHPRRLLAFAGPHAADSPAPRWRPDEHERTRWCRFLGGYGIDADPADLRLTPPAATSFAPGAVVVHPGANAASRCWPAERYAETVRTLQAVGRRVVLSGGPGDEEVLAALLARLDPMDVQHAVPFARFGALVAGASALISTDTGPAHLAVAYGTASVTLFGPVSPALWGPPSDRRHRVLYHPGPAGDPNGDSPDPLLLQIDPCEVVRAVEDLPAPGPTRGRVEAPHA